MFDTRPIERFGSIAVLGIVPALSLCPLLLFATFALIAADSGGPVAAVLATGCCSTLAGLVVGLGLVWLVRWSRTGQARPFLEHVASGVGDETAEIQVATFLWSMLSPRLTGSVDGMDYRLSLRRQAGVLSPSRVGGRFALFGWMFDLRLEAPIGVKVGFAPPNMSEMGLGLVGLRGPGQLVEGLKVFGGDTEPGAAIVHDQAVQAAARAVVTFGHPNGVLVRLGPDAVVINGFLRPDVTPESTVAFLRATADLARAATTRIRS